MVKLPTTNEPEEPGFVEDRTQFLHDYAALLSLWGEFELMLEVKIAKLAKLAPIDASTILGGLSFGNKPSILYSLLSQRGKASAIPAIKAVINHARRNALVHGVVGSEPDDRTFAFYKREIGDSYMVKQLDFTATSFNEHFERFRVLFKEAADAIEICEEDLDEYGEKAGLFGPAR